jgi:hypothetical protein
MKPSEIQILLIKKMVEYELNNNNYNILHQNIFCFIENKYTNKRYQIITI